MGFRRTIAFTKLGSKISKIENELIDLSKKVEVEIEANGEVSQLSKDIQMGIHEYMSGKLLDVIDKYGWSLDTPYKMAGGSSGIYETTLGALVDELASKFMALNEIIKNH